MRMTSRPVFWTEKKDTGGNELFYVSNKPFGQGRASGRYNRKRSESKDGISSILNLENNISLQTKIFLFNLNGEVISTSDRF